MAFRNGFSQWLCDGFCDGFLQWLFDGFAKAFDGFAMAFVVALRWLFVVAVAIALRWLSMAFRWLFAMAVGSSSVALFLRWLLRWLFDGFCNSFEGFAIALKGASDGFFVVAFAVVVLQWLFAIAVAIALKDVSDGFSRGGLEDPMACGNGFSRCKQ